MKRFAVVLGLFALVGASAVRAQEPPAPSMRGETLHRMTLLRAAPGRLLDLVAAVKGRGLVLRHSQGDQWDLMVLAPVAGYADLAAAPPLADAALVAWQEDELVRGPDVARLDGFSGAGLYHIEMFVALAGRRGDVVHEREMENAYLAALGRPRNAIFVREFGAAWDSFTIGPYRSWKHFAERDDIPPERSSAAARAAGFEGDDRIGPYLRSLIQSHHDTLATPVR
ncbi:MAG TPA: hypothetical protein VFK70_10355 [Vicinamibacteria bacterium]|nr:hypothetical protein [Vicinamibacteria bacterium]